MAKRYKFSQDAEEIQGLLNKIDSLDLNQQCRCSQSCELENIKLDNVVYSVITRAVSNLINYYTKSEVDTKLSSIHQFVTRQVDVLPTPSASTMYALYFVPSENRSAGNVTDEFITINRNGSYVWEQIGASPVDLSGYVTDDELNSILSDYVSSDDFSNAISELSSRIDGLHEVKYTEQQLTNAQKSQARANIGAGTYSKPSNGIPASDLAEGVIPNVSQFITKTVNDLVNYYTKSETYTRAEVQALIAAINQFHYEVYASLSDAADPHSNVLYLIGPIGTGSDKYEEYVFTTEWVKIGDTSINLSGYVTTQALNTALASYVTSTDFATAMAGKQDKLTAGSGISINNNVIAAVPDVVWVTYGTTTAQEIADILTEGNKLIFLKEGDFIYGYNGKDSTYYYFTSLYSAGYDRNIRLRIPNNVWSIQTFTLERVSNKSQSVSTDKDSTDKYPSTKAVADAIEYGKQIFWAEYGVTTSAEIDAAVAAGKAVFCKYNDRQYPLGLLQAGNYITFGIIYGGSSYYLLLNRTNNAWSQGSNSLENTSNRSQSVETDKTSTAKYPSVKAVYDVVVEATDEEIDEMMESVLN